MRDNTRRTIRRKIGPVATAALADDLASAITLTGLDATLPDDESWVDFFLTTFSASNWRVEEEWFSFDGGNDTVRLAQGFYSGWVFFRADGVVDPGALVALLNVNSDGGGAVLPDDALMVTPGFGSTFRCFLPFATFVDDDSDGDVYVRMLNGDAEPIDIDNLAVHIVRERGY